MENVVCTPHIGYVTRDEYELQFSNILTRSLLTPEGAPTNVVNPQVFDVFEKPAGILKAYLSGWRMLWQRLPVIFCTQNRTGSPFLSRTEPSSLRVIVLRLIPNSLRRSHWIPHLF